MQHTNLITPTGTNTIKMKTTENKTATAEATATDAKLSMREKLALTIEKLETKSKEGELTGFESQRLINATKKMQERQPSAIYKAIKQFHNTKLGDGATNEEKLTRMNLRKLTGGKLPTFGEWISEFPENANFSFWSGLTAVRKACKSRNEA